MQVADHVLRAFVGEGYVHHGGVYATLGHLLASFGHRSTLSHHLKVRLLVHEVGGGLAEGGVVLHEQDECHLFLAPFSRLSLSVTYVPTNRPKVTYVAVNAPELRRTPVATMTPTLARTKAMISQAPPLGSLPDRRIATPNITVPRKIKRSTASRVSNQRAPQRFMRTPKLQRVMTM